MAGARSKKAGRPPGQVFAEQVGAVRFRKGWTDQTLADRLLELGYRIDRSTIYRLEHGKRSGLSLDEAFAVAAALEVSPLSLVLPLEPGQPVAVAPRLTVSSAEARAWARGDRPLPGQDPEFFYQERPKGKWVDVLVQRRIQALDALVSTLDDAWSAEDTEQVADALDALDEEIQRQRSEAKRLARRQGKGH